MTTLSRRRLLQVSAAGVITISTVGLRPAMATPYEKFTWISPRGNLEVLDDYAYWVAKKMGYFGDLKIDIQPGPSDGTATVKFVDVGQADMGFPSPGIFAFALQEGMKLKSVFHCGARDTFSFAFRKGEGSTDLKALEGKTILLGSAAWQSICDPLLASQGVDVSTVKYVEAGWPAWGTMLAAGQGDAALSWESLRAEWIASGLEFDYWLGVQHSHLPANTYVVRAEDLEDPDKVEFLKKYLQGWAKGMEFAEANPAFTAQAVFDAFPTLGANLGPQLGVTSLLQQMNVVRGDMEKRGGWGWHDMASWQAFFDVAEKIGQIGPIKAEEVCTNELIEAANDFDHAAVRAEAEAAGIPEAFAGIDIAQIRAELFDQGL